MERRPPSGDSSYVLKGASVNERHRAAIQFSLVSSAKMNHLESMAWLSALFTKLPWHRNGEAFDQARQGDSVAPAKAAIDDQLQIYIMN